MPQTRENRNNNFSIFPSFADMPDPPVERIVEPKSFRNTLIKIMGWMAILPVVTLFFLLGSQIQWAQRDADNVLISVARSIASSVSSEVLDTVKLVRFSHDLVTNGQSSRTEELRMILDKIGKRQHHLVYAAWIDEKSNVIASRLFLPINGYAIPDLRQALDARGDASFVLSRVDTRKELVSFGVKMQDPVRDHLYFYGILRTSQIHALLENASDKGRISIALLEGRQRIFGSSDAMLNSRDLVFSDKEWESVITSEQGLTMRSSGYRNVAQVRSFVHIPNMNWTVVVSEPLLQRDETIRSSINTALFVLAITFCASILAGYFTASPLTHSVNLLTEAVRRFGKTGEKTPELTKKLEQAGTTELIALGKSFEQMADNIQDSNSKLERLNAELEQQVQERTATVVLRNKELRALHRLLVPFHRTSENEPPEPVLRSVEEFRAILGLTQLRFIACTPSVKEEIPVDEHRISVQINGIRFGWLEVSENDVMTAERVESLHRLANSLAILFANNNLVMQLAKEHATLATVFDSITDGVVILGRSGKIIYANDLAAQILNHELPVVGMRADELVNRNWKPQKNGRLESFEAFPTRMRLIPKEADAGKSCKTLDIVVFKVSDLPGFSGERTGLLIRDITKEAEIERMKDSLMSIVAHELKTPVTAINLLAESLRRIHPKTEKIDLDEVDELVEESSRLGRLIDDLLDVSRIEGGAMKLAPKVVQVASLIDRAVRLTRSRYAIEVERRIDPDAETIAADPDRLTQVFVNLLNNAARYKKPEQTSAVCFVTVKPADDFIRIEVTDHGRGIPDEALDSVFKPFYQSDMTDRRPNSGTGLGLAIVKGIVQAHSGTVTVQSELGQYTKFVILLPL